MSGRRKRRDDDYHEISDGIYLGNNFVAKDEKLLDSLNIVAIVNITHDIPNVFEEKYAYHNVFIQDGEDENILPYIDGVISFIDMYSHEGGVYIHCYAGISRSSTFTIAYLMKTMNLSLQDAFDLVKSRRDFIEPNRGFMKQLRKYEKILAGK